MRRELYFNDRLFPINETVIRAVDIVEPGLLWVTATCILIGMPS